MSGVNVGSQKEAIRVRRQQGGGVMFWAGIISNDLVGPWKDPEGVKMTSVAYVAFVKEHLEQQFESKPLSLKRKMIFMHDNAPLHAEKTTTRKRSVSKMVVSWYCLPFCRI